MKIYVPLSANIVSTDSARGFTLIEFMVAIGMGMVVLLGTVMMFSTQSKVASSLTSRTARLGDLYIASQMMQSELRNAQSGSISWASKVLSYTDQDGNTGKFEYQKTSNDRLYWQRPGVATFDEMIRDLDTSSGLTIASSGGVWTIALLSSYLDESKKTKTLKLSFKIWARN